MGARYRLAKEAYAHAKALWKEQAEVYRLCRRRVRAFRHEVYKARNAAYSPRPADRHGLAPRQLDAARCRKAVRP